MPRTLDRAWMPASTFERDLWGRQDQLVREGTPGPSPSRAEPRVSGLPLPMSLYAGPLLAFRTYYFVFQTPVAEVDFQMAVHVADTARQCCSSSQAVAVLLEPAWTRDSEVLHHSMSKVVLRLTFAVARWKQYSAVGSALDKHDRPQRNEFLQRPGRRGSRLIVGPLNASLESAGELCFSKPSYCRFTG